MTAQNASTFLSSTAPPPTSSSSLPDPVTTLSLQPSRSPSPTLLPPIHPSSGQRLLNPPSLIEYKNLRFLVMDAPSDGNLQLYMKEMEKHGVTDVVRACDPTYSKEPLERIGIQVHELNFKDGDPPPSSIVDHWLNLVYLRFIVSLPTSAEKASSSKLEGSFNGYSSPSNSTIAVHCVAGLGRAPVLIAIALIEFTGINQLEAIEFIRKRRRGAFNSRQIQFIDSYKRRGVGKSGGFLGKKSKSEKLTVESAGDKGKSADKCVVM